MKKSAKAKMPSKPTSKADLKKLKMDDIKQDKAMMRKAKKKVKKVVKKKMKKM